MAGHRPAPSHRLRPALRGPGPLGQATVGRGLARGPELVCVATSLEDGGVRVLDGLRDPETAVRAVRASCSLPILGGSPRRFRGELLGDGGLVEPIPYRTALACGATHVLVLRSRKASRRKGRESRLTRTLARRTAPALLELLEDHPRRYNKDADTLERAADPALPLPDRDVVLRGAGLAAARRGLSVALVDRDPDPAAYKRICSTACAWRAGTASGRSG